MNMKNNETNEQCKFVFNLAQRLNLRGSNKHVALKNLSIYYTWKNIKQQYRNNRLKIITPTLYHKFKLLESSYSMPDIQDHIECIITQVQEIAQPGNMSRKTLIYFN